MKKLTIAIFIALCGLAVSTQLDVTQWGPLGPSNAPYFSKLYQGMSLEAPFRLRSPSKQFDLIVTLDGRVVLYDNNLKKIVDTYVETTKAGPYVLAMKKNCQLAYLTNFKVDVELTGSGTCFAAVRDNGQIVLLDDYCVPQNINGDYPDLCTPGEAHGKIKQKPITYTFADEPSKPPVAEEEYNGDGNTGFKPPKREEADNLPFNPQRECPTGTFVYNPDTEEWDFVPSGEFPKVDPSKLDGWYEYDPNTQQWVYKKNDGVNNPWGGNDQGPTQNLPFNPNSASGPGSWVYNPETGNWEFVPQGSELPFDTNKYPSYPLYKWNPDTNQWDYTQGGKNLLPFNPLDSKNSGVYVFNPDTNTWQWYENESQVPFDFKNGEKPWFTYNPLTRTWNGNQLNPYENLFQNKGSYIEGGNGISKLYEGQFLVSPAYLTSPDGSIHLILKEDGSLGIYENNGRTLVDSVVDFQGTQNGPYALSMEQECKLVLQSKNTYKEVFGGNWNQTCFLFVSDNRTIRLTRENCTTQWWDGRAQGQWENICFKGESQKYRRDLPRSAPYKLYPGQSLISGQVLRSEDNKFELRLNNEGGLFIWDNEKDIFYRGIEDDVGNSGPYQLFVNVDCTFVLKSSDGFIQRSYGKSEKSVCFLYLQNNKELVQYNEECNFKWRSRTAQGGSHNRCYYGEAIDRAIVNPTDEPLNPEFPIKLYEGTTVQAPFIMRSGNGVTEVRFLETGELIIWDNQELKQLKKYLTVPNRFLGKGPYTLSMETECNLVVRTKNGEQVSKMSGNNSKTCFAYARYQKSLVLLDENCVKVATSGTGYPPEFNNCVAGESFEKSLLPNSYNTRPQQF